MNILAKQHVETRFVKVQAEKSPFLAEKLKIVVLPTIALIKIAKVDDYAGVKLYEREPAEEKSLYLTVPGHTSVRPQKRKWQCIRLAPWCHP